MDILNSFAELLELSQRQYEDLAQLQSLVTTGALKFMAKGPKEELLRQILDRMSDIDDATRATIKAARQVRRERLKDDIKVSNLMSVLASVGFNVDDALEGKLPEPPPGAPISIRVSAEEPKNPGETG